MTIYYVGTSLAEVHNSSACSTTTTTGIDTNYVREGIIVPISGSGFFRLNFTALSEGWIHFRMHSLCGSTAALVTGQLWMMYSTGFSAVQPLFQLDYDGAASANGSAIGYGVIEYWDGAAFQEGNAETTSGLTISVGYNVDIHFKLDNTVGYIVQYVNGVEACRYDGDTIRTSATTLDRIEFWSPDTNGGKFVYYSELIIADEDTRGMRLASLAPTANGANTAFVNDYTAVDETGVNDADYITSATANEVETYTVNDISGTLSGYDVLAVAIVARAKKGTSGPANLQGAVRISSTDYFSANVTGLDVVYSSVMAIWTANPATSGAWTQAAVNGLEAGLKSIT